MGFFKRNAKKDKYTAPKKKQSVEKQVEEAWNKIIVEKSAVNGL